MKPSDSQAALIQWGIELETRLPQILADIPLGRMASPEDCAAAIAFLLRDETEYMSGIVIDINGASYLR